MATGVQLVAILENMAAKVLVHGGINNPPAVKPKLLRGLREICIKRRRGLFLA
jgi:hypothetical protein